MLQEISMSGTDTEMSGTDTEMSGTDTEIQSEELSNINRASYRSATLLD
jgi:hypothetical protein